jgi:hypothetical protein
MRTALHQAVAVPDSGPSPEEIALAGAEASTIRDLLLGLALDQRVLRRETLSILSRR